MHRLLGLEAEHKPLPGYEPALNDVLAYLHKVCIILNVQCYPTLSIVAECYGCLHGHGLQVKGSKGDRDRNMRKLIYSLLSSEGSLTAQRVLY